MREIKHLSVHQWLRSAISDSQQPSSPIGFLFLKLPPPPCAVLLVLNHDFPITFVIFSRHPVVVDPRSFQCNGLSARFFASRPLSAWRIQRLPGASVVNPGLGNPRTKMVGLVGFLFSFNGISAAIYINGGFSGHFPLPCLIPGGDLLQCKGTCFQVFLFLGKHPLSPEAQ